jgi:hypothetical protein
MRDGPGANDYGDAEAWKITTNCRVLVVFVSSFCVLIV